MQPQPGHTLRRTLFGSRPQPMHSSPVATTISFRRTHPVPNGRTAPVSSVSVPSTAGSHSALPAAGMYCLNNFGKLFLFTNSAPAGSLYTNQKRCSR